MKRVIKTFLKQLSSQSKNTNQSVSEDVNLYTGKTIPLKQQMSERWFTYLGYRLRVHGCTDALIWDSGVREPCEVRSVCFEVEYINLTQTALRYTTLQWLLYDRTGYQYEPEIRRQFYGDAFIHRLQEGRLAAERRIRGWVAFQIPVEAELDYLQFRRNYMTDETLEIDL